MRPLRARRETLLVRARCSLAGRRSILALAVGAWIALIPSSVQTSHQQTQSRSAAATSAPRTFLDTYCVGCHNQKLRTAGLALDTVDVTNPSANAEVWEHVIRKLRAGTMPPAGRPRPDRATYDATASWLEGAIDRAAAASPNPGRTSTVQRLTRTEYQNAIRDLLAVEVDVAALLPGEDTSDSGFDNNADVLSIAPTQLERYLSAARKITRLATGLPPPAPVVDIFDVPLLMVQDDRQSEDLPHGSRGGAAIRYYFPVDGEYLIKVRLQKNYADYVRGLGRPHELDIRLDGALIKRFIVGGEARGRRAPASFGGVLFGDREWEEYVLHADERLEVRLPVSAGPHLVGVAFVRKMWELEGIPQPRQAGSVLSDDEMYDGNPAVDSVAIGGPHQITGPGDTPSRQKIFTCRPQRVADEEPCATKILSTLARRAYRRPVKTRDVQILMAFFKAGRSNGEGFDSSIQLALERLLVDPEFLLRIHPKPENLAPGRAYRISDLEVASRLSFFLWSSLPDETLLDLAERGRLADPKILEQQVRRMVTDSRATALVDNFSAQWLHLRNLADVVVDPLMFPDFDDNLREAFQRETELFLASTLREDRSVLGLLSADYTFVNERLARHYGIPGIYGSRFRRITLPNTHQRGGLLGHGGLLAMTAYPNRTSPVLRGKWLLDTILGAPPPAPPANVPALPERGENGKTVSVRARLEQHRKNPGCASCHATIDPLGFALENFDAIGTWRTLNEDGKPVDAAGTMPSGAKLDGLAGLRALLLDQREQFVGTLTEKLLSYALGRALEYYDQPTVRQIVRDAASSDYRWSSLIFGIVKSPAFLMRRSE